MLESEKLYVIDLGDDVNPPRPDEPRPETTGNSVRRPAAVRVQAQKVRPKPVSRPPATGHFALRLTLTFLLGPFAILLWPEGRRGPGWPALAVLSGPGVVALVWNWDRLLAFGTHPFHALLLAGLTALLMMGTFTVWARALHLAYSARPQGLRNAPGWVKSAWGVTGLSLLAPGFGLFLTGARQRAVAVLWLLWPGALAAVLLIRSGGTLAWLQDSGVGLPVLMDFEYILMIAAGLTGLAAAGWLVQALAGMHRHSVQARQGGSLHGDRFAVALLAAVVGFVILAQPVKMAGLANDAREILQANGLRVIPLHLAGVAHRLDPGDPAYALQVASLHREIGNTEAADRMQEALEEDFRAYYGVFGPAPAPETPKPVAQAPKPAPRQETTKRARLPRWTFSPAPDYGSKPVMP